MIIFAKSQHFTVCWFGHFSLLKLNKSSPLVADRVLNAKWMYKIYLKAGMQRQKFIKYRATFMHAFDTCWNSFGQLNVSSFLRCSAMALSILPISCERIKPTTRTRNNAQESKKRTNEKKNGSNLKGKEDTIEWRTMHIFSGFTFPSAQSLWTAIKSSPFTHFIVYWLKCCTQFLFSLLLFRFVLLVCIVCTENKKQI